MEVERKSRSSAAQYNAYDNSLHLEIEKWQELTSAEKEQKQNTILHEMGHLKVTQKSIKNNTLFVQCGFNREEITLQPIFLPNGDIFYKPVEGKQKIYKPEIIIEEILNDFDCSQVSKNFHGHYPNFGYRLNNLCDNNLQMARYTDGMNILKERLLAIIKSKDALEELLGTLYASVYSYDKRDRKSSEEQANQLILKYEKEKQRRR